ncbi:MAG TPA: GxxExxY protein [Chthonomonadaceae bacterium]|nr:GxxExxY protein [Chthonomonadaceae bacterium]
MSENEVAREIVDAPFHVHCALGPGLLESAYERILAYQLRKRGLRIAAQVRIPVVYDGVEFERGFVADLIVNERVIVELKSVEKMATVHKKQLMTYLKLTIMRLGLLINFGELLIRDGITRIVNGLTEE